MKAVPALQELAGLIEGEPEVVLGRLLTLVCEQLGMDVAFVSVLDGSGNRTVRMSVESDGTASVMEVTEPLAVTWCGRVVADGGYMVADGSTDAALQSFPSTSVFQIVSFAGVPLQDDDGTVFGTLCALSRAPHTSLNSRDQATLTGLATVVGPLVRALDDVPETATAPVELAAMVTAVESAEDLEGLSRPLLEALADLTGLASTYLTVVDQDADVQEVRYARNTRDGFAVPEGLFVPWEDTLCKRALDEKRPCTNDVPAVWGDSEAARALGIQVYVSVPVEMPDGTVWGTLCAADSVSAGDAAAHLPTMRVFARLIASEVQREAAVTQAREDADTDALTRCSTRRVVEPWLTGQLAVLPPEDVVVVAFADLNSLKGVNDTLGHAAGDAVLVEVGERLRATARPGDLVARLGGDEFLVAARMPRSAAGQLSERVEAALTFSLPWLGSTLDVRAAVGVATSDQGDGPAMVALADAAMYLGKNSLRSR